MTLTELKFNGEGKSQFMFSQFELEFLQAIAVPEAQIETLSLGRAAVGRPAAAGQGWSPISNVPRVWAPPAAWLLTSASNEGYPNVRNHVEGP